MWSPTSGRDHPHLRRAPDAQRRRHLTYDPNGQFETLDDGADDTDSFTYKANDGDADSNEATVMITITGVNDAPVAVGRHRHHRRGHGLARL